MPQPSSRWNRPRALLAAAALLLGSTVIGAVPAGAVDAVRVTVTVHTVWQVACDDNDVLDIGDTCGNDYYAKAFFPDGERVSPRAPDDRTDITPNWQLSGVVDRDAGPFGLRLQLWDHDSTSGDDLVDIAPPGDDRNLDVTVDPRTGDFAGDVFTPSIGFGKGAASDAAAVWFSITLGDSTDFDGDGLHDGIERSGIVTDSNGTIPEHGLLRAVEANGRGPQAASPCRPTVLTEVDWMVFSGFGGHNHRPSQPAVDEAVATMDAGDVPARPGCPYAGAAAGSGVQLLMVLDDQLPEIDKLTWGSGPGTTTGQSIRTANFDAGLRPYFHYSLWNHNQPDSPPATPGGPPVVNSSSGFCCSDSGKDVLVSLGQWANSVGTTRDQSGTFVHELGHALGLGHGGVDDVNCKPNYLSIMSYVYQTTGIPDASLPAPTADLNGDTVVDGRDRLRMDLSRAKLLDLDEDALDEEAGIGAGPDTFFWDGDGARPWRPSAGDADVDWDRDTPTTIDVDDVAADVNFMGIPGQGCPTGTPPPGTAGVAELLGNDDWATLEYKGPLSPPSSGVASANELDQPTADFIKAAVREAHEPDRPVGLAHRRTRSRGCRPVPDLHARRTQRRDRQHRLPGQRQAGPARGRRPRLGDRLHRRRGHGHLRARRPRPRCVDLPDRVRRGPGRPRLPQRRTEDVSATATLSHDGPDAAPSDNTATATTRVYAEADVRVTGSTTTGPLEVLVGQTGTLTTSTTIDNVGPSSPIDTTLTTSAVGAGVTVAPAVAVASQPALAIGPGRAVVTNRSVRVRPAGPADRHRHREPGARERRGRRPRPVERRPEQRRHDRLRDPDRGQRAAGRQSELDQPEHRRDAGGADDPCRRVRPADHGGGDADHRRLRALGVEEQPARRGHGHRRAGAAHGGASGALVRARTTAHGTPTSTGSCTSSPPSPA